MNNSQNLTLHVFSNGACGPAEQKAFEKTYALWKSVWGQTLKELDGLDVLTSDNFSRQHEILSLFIDDICVAIVCHRYVDLSLLSSRDDSYFKPWPQEAFKKLCAHGNKAAIGSQITIHSGYRGESPFGRIKNVITSLSLRHLMDTDVDVIAGTMRADKGMNRLFYNCGAEPIESHVILHNVEVDLVAFFPKVNPIKIASESRDAIEMIWGNRVSENSKNINQLKRAG